MSKVLEKKTDIKENNIISNGGDSSAQLAQTGLAQMKQDSHAEMFGSADKPNNTGLPDDLKSGIESLSGQSMDDVTVQRNSSEPAKVGAHAFAQGTDIHLASGQEKHLAHEAWHVVQQKQGKVSPTTSIGGMPVNDNPSLEKEADTMGAKALQAKAKDDSVLAQSSISSTSTQLKGDGDASNSVVDLEKNMAKASKKTAKPATEAFALTSSISSYIKNTRNMYNDIDAFAKASKNDPELGKISTFVGKLANSGKKALSGISGVNKSLEGLAAVGQADAFSATYAGAQAMIDSVESINESIAKQLKSAKVNKELKASLTKASVFLSNRSAQNKVVFDASKVAYTSLISAPAAP